MLWDVFCRVVDNFGDIGVCWRLAADLAARGQRIRLWVDDPSALAWLAPAGSSGVEMIHWTGATPIPPPGQVVIEAFGCDPPEAFVAAMAACPRAPVWLNLEYLSAEPYVERSHGLRSPQGSGPGRGLDKWFFYPGFTPATGGLLRETGLLAEQAAFDPASWCSAQGITRRPGERLVSLFCYAGANVPALLHRLAGTPTLVVTAPGPATDGIADIICPPGVRAQPLRWLSQPDYDRLLWSCDLNLVRGEDSFVRAQWAGRPFLWHIYPQHDGVHADKLDAFLARFLAGSPGDLAASLRAWMHGWNGLSASLPGALPPWPDWAAQAARWRDSLLGQTDLTSQLLAFVLERR